MGLKLDERPKSLLLSLIDNADGPLVVALNDDDDDDDSLLSTTTQSDLFA